MADNPIQRAGQSVRSVRDAGRSADPARAAARAAMERAGHAVLGVAVDRAISGVEGVATRLDRVAAGTTGSGGSATGGLSVSALAGKAGGAATAVRSGVGAGFGLVARTVMRVVEFLRRIAIAVIEALRGLAGRLRAGAATGGAGEPEAPETESGEAAQPAARGEAAGREAGPDAGEQPRERPGRPPRAEQARRRSAPPEQGADGRRASPRTRRPARAGGGDADRAARRG